MSGPHLTAEELDALHAQRCPEPVASHLATCSDCAALVERDRRLISALAALPQFAVPVGFSDRVMACVMIPAAALVTPASVDATTPRSRAARHRAMGAAILATGAVGAACVWAGGHSAEALRWSAPAVQGAGHSLWLSLQTVVVNATGQPWFSSLRDTLATPVRALAVLAGLAGVYALGLLGLRRLLTEPATHASW
ncbi:MAG: anti-sigma factor family protein [Gemmatimonadales bacterium]